MQCVRLRNECTDLLLVLRDNAQEMVGTDYTKALDEAELCVYAFITKAPTPTNLQYHGTHI